MHASDSFDDSASFATHYCRLAQWPLPLRRKYLAEACARVERGDSPPQALVQLLLAECDAAAVLALTDCWYAGTVRERGLEVAREQVLDWLARGLATRPTVVAARLCEDADETLRERVEALVPGSLAATLNDPLRPRTGPTRPVESAPTTRSGRAFAQPAAIRTRPSARTLAARSCGSR
jgi:hypothetical protein